MIFNILIFYWDKLFGVFNTHVINVDEFAFEYAFDSFYLFE